MTEEIGIVAWGAMCDVLTATPIVRQIRRLHPDARVTWYIRDKFAEVIENNPDIDRVEAVALPDGYPTRQDAELVMDREILAMARTFSDKVYDLQYWPRYSNFYEDRTEDFISLRARNAGLAKPDDRSIVLAVTKEQHDAVERFYLDHLDGTEGFITVNHISYAASPIWSLDNYTKLTSILNEKHIDVVFTGAPNEPIPENGIDARGMPYCEWASLISMSDLWLGLDSGAVALACASDVPIIKLHSPDFPLEKTGIRAMGLRDDVLELCPAPNPETLADIIMEGMK